MRAQCDANGRIEVAAVGGPPECGAQVGQLSGEPRVSVSLPRAIPQRENVRFAVGEVSSVCVMRLDSVASRDEMLVGELADGLQHGKPSLSRRSVSDEQGFAYQCVEQVEDGVVIEVIESGYRAGTFQIESAGEDRTPIKKRLLRVVEVLVRPSHRLAQ